MKKIIIFFLGVIFLSISEVLALQRLSITVVGDSIFVSGDSLARVYFTPGIHHPDSTGEIFGASTRAKLPADFDLSAASKSSAGFYHLTSGPVPVDFDDSLRVIFRVSGKIIFCRGREFHSEAIIAFPDFFTAREFPFFWADSGQFEVETYQMNGLDSVKVVFIWSDSSGQALLDTAKTIASAAIEEVGKFAPNFWHCHIQNWGGGKYMLTVFLGIGHGYEGLEHFSSPFVVVPDWLQKAEDTVVHEMFHSLVGKALMPTEYIQSRDDYIPTDVLWFYEGLTELVGNRYTLFPNPFSFYLNRHVLQDILVPESDLRRLSRESSKEKRGYIYYNKGYLLFLCLASQINLDDWLRWLFEEELNGRQIPVPTTSDSVVHWLNKYQPGAGDYLEELLPGGYGQIADSLLYYYGFREVCLKDWSNDYIGPYHHQGIYVFSDLDTLGLEANKFKFVCVISPEGDSLQVYPEDQPGWKLISTHPDSLFDFVIEKDDSTRVTVRLSKNIHLPNGECFTVFLRHHMAQIPLVRRRGSLEFLRQIIRRAK